MKKHKLAYDVVLEPSDEGGFTVYVPSLRGCVSEGETEEEALENIKDAIHTWLDSWEDIAQGVTSPSPLPSPIEGEGVLPPLVGGS